MFSVLFTEVSEVMTQAVETPRTTIDRAPISCQHNIRLDYSLHDVYHATPWCWRFYGLKKHISSRSCQICRPRPTDSHADTSLAFQDIQTHQDMSLTRAEEISGNPAPPPVDFQDDSHVPLGSPGSTLGVFGAIHGYSAQYYRDANACFSG